MADQPKLQALRDRLMAAQSRLNAAMSPGEYMMQLDKVRRDGIDVDRLGHVVGLEGVRSDVDAKYLEIAEARTGLVVNADGSVAGVLADRSSTSASDIRESGGFCAPMAPCVTVTCSDPEDHEIDPTALMLPSDPDPAHPGRLLRYVDEDGDELVVTYYDLDSYAGAEGENLLLRVHRDGYDPISVIVPLELLARVIAAAPDVVPGLSTPDGV